MTEERSIEAFEARSWPGHVIFGAGSFARVPDEVAAADLRRVLVIHGGSGRDAAARLAAGLGDRLAATFDEVRQHVPGSLVEAASHVAADAEADGIVTIGGGSATGLGKAVAVERGLPLLAVPTTYAGSEMTPIFGITGETKRTGHDVAALPRTVVYDPELTLGLPPRASAASGMNAIAQAVGSLWAAPDEPVTSTLAEEAVRRLAAALPRVVAQPGDLEARAEALRGAYLAGTCLARVATGLHHKLCHALGGRYDLAHAATHAVVLPYTTAYNTVAAPRVADRIARALGAADAAGGLRELNQVLGNPASLAELGLPPEAADEVADDLAPRLGDVPPRPADRDELRSLLRAAIDGSPPTSKPSPTPEPTSASDPSTSPDPTPPS